jgi:predicted RNase H-like nuclease
MPSPLPYSPLAGVVPCPGGWLVLPARLLTATIVAEEPFVVPALAEVLDYRPAFTTMVIDAPIGLPDLPFGGWRACDREARELLGWPRRSAIAPVPSREALYTGSFEAARRAEPWLTPLAYRRFRWIREVDTELQAYHQRRVFSGHPELSFLPVNGDRPAATSVLWSDGPAERAQLLRERLPGLGAVMAKPAPRGSRPHHVAEAATLLWTARRISGRSIARLPFDPQWDEQGRRMELVR